MIRRAKLADVEALAQLERHFPSDRLSADRFRYLLRKANADIWVYEKDQHILGNAIVLYRSGAKKARLYSIVVAESARGRGVARRLLDAAETGARTKKCQTVVLEVRPDNQTALRLYAKRGYRVMQKLRGFYEDGANAIRLERSLGVYANRPAALAA